MHFAWTCTIYIEESKNAHYHVHFCLVYKLDLFPASSLQICRYLQFLSYQHASVDSSLNYVSGVRTLHLLLGFDLPNPHDYLFQLMAKGICRDKGHIVKQVAAISPEMLASISNLVNVKDTKQLACWISILLGFCTLFRKSNLVPVSGVKFNPHHQLTRGHFTRMQDCYVASVYWAKNIQYHDRALDIPLLTNVDFRICPVF